VFTGYDGAFDMGFGKEAADELKETLLHGGPQEGGGFYLIYTDSLEIARGMPFLSMSLSAASYGRGAFMILKAGDIFTISL
jgi:hypothetical protein